MEKYLQGIDLGFGSLRMWNLLNQLSKIFILSLTSRKDLFVGIVYQISSILLVYDEPLCNLLNFFSVLSVEIFIVKSAADNDFLFLLFLFVQLTKQTTVQATGVASSLVELIQGSGFKLQTLNLSFQDEEDLLV